MYTDDVISTGDEETQFRGGFGSYENSGNRQRAIRLSW
jgi:hypothetical protein